MSASSKTVQPTTPNKDLDGSTRGMDPSLQDVVWRGEILKQIFGDVGELVSDFSCAVETNILLHGRMYLTDKFLCFYSNLFGLEKKIRIPFTHVSEISKENTALVIPNAISITTYRKEYIFRSFWDRDEAYALIKGLIDKAKGIESHDEAIEESTHPPLPNAAGSDHVEEKRVYDANRSGKVVVGQVVDVKPGPVEAVPAAGVKAADKPSEKGEKPEDKSKPRSGSSGSAGKNDDTEVNTESGRVEMEHERRTASLTPSDLRASLVVEIAKSKLKHKVMEFSLNMTVSEFADAFVTDTAAHSWKEYHEMEKDQNVQSTLWDDESTALGAARELRFLKPVNLPGCASTRAKKLQRYRRFGDVGLVVCSSTRLEDVPAADTFSVEDMLAVTATNEHEILVEIYFEVKFIKSTLFRRIIESNTDSEMTKWLEKFGKHLQKVVQDSHKPKRRKSQRARSRSKSRDVVPPVAAPAAPAHLSANEKFMKTIAQNSIFLALAWALLVFTLLFFGFQWQSVNKRLTNMEALFNDGFAVPNAAIESGVKQLLSRCGETSSCSAEEILQQLQKIVEN